LFNPMTGAIMQKFLVLFSAIAALSGVAVAAPSPSEVTPSRMQQMKAQTLDDVADVYSLSDGRRLQLVKVDGRLYADLIRRNRVPLRAVSDQSFRSEDGTLTIEVSPGNGSEKQIVLNDATPERAPHQRPGMH
jgi:hypothetical protein